MTTVPDLVRGIRERRSLTQERLAQELGVTFSTVNGWENGRHCPIPIALRALEALGRECGLNPVIKVSTRSLVQTNGPRSSGGTK